MHADAGNPLCMPRWQYLARRPSGLPGELNPAIFDGTQAAYCHLSGLTRLRALALLDSGSHSLQLEPATLAALAPSLTALDLRGTQHAALLPGGCLLLLLTALQELCLGTDLVSCYGGFVAWKRGDAALGHRLLCSVCKGQDIAWVGAASKAVPFAAGAACRRGA